MSNFEFNSKEELRYIFLDSLNFYVLNTLDKEVFRFIYVPEKRYSIHYWIDYVTPEQMVEIYICTAKFCFHHQNRILGTLNNLENMEGSFEPTNEWFIKEYMPVSVKNGFKYSAVVRPKDFFTHLALDDLIEIAIYENKDFDNHEEALAWLESMLENYTFSK